MKKLSVIVNFILIVGIFVFVSMRTGSFVMRDFLENITLPEAVGIVVVLLFYLILGKIFFFLSEKYIPKCIEYCGKKINYEVQVTFSIRRYHILNFLHTSQNGLSKKIFMYTLLYGLLFGLFIFISAMAFIPLFFFQYFL